MNFKKKLYFMSASVVVLALGLVLAFHSELQVGLMKIVIHPDHEFADGSTPIQPDYRKPDHWAALPDREDWADRLPTGAADLQSSAPADVFFVHPTTYLSPNAWNQALDDERTNQQTDELVIQSQAGAFNSCCRVYAPRYRQATLAAFFTESISGSQALALAYLDIVAAFHHFIAQFNTGRPFLIAAHSQGAHHIDKLLANEIIGTELENRLVAAYPIGFAIDGSNGLAVCQTPAQTRCQVSWNSVRSPAGSLFDSAGDICVNPLTWRVDGEHADHAANLGAVNFRKAETHEPGAVDAQCREGLLYISEIRSDRYSLMPLGRDNYHIYDYAFYYVNIRQNAQTRVDAFLREAMQHISQS